MSRSTEAFQGSASGAVGGGHPRETASHVYNIGRFQQDGAPSSVASLAGGATPRDQGARLHNLQNVINEVDNMFGAQSAQAAASAAANSASGYGQNAA